MIYFICQFFWIININSPFFGFLRSITDMRMVLVPEIIKGNFLLL